MIIKLNLTSYVDPRIVRYLGFFILVLVVLVFGLATFREISPLSGIFSFLSSLITNSSGHATPIGWLIFAIIVIGAPLTGILNLLTILDLNLNLTRWKVLGSVSFRPIIANAILAMLLLGVSAFFDGHLLIDSIACYAGNIPVCD